MEEHSNAIEIKEVTFEFSGKRVIDRLTAEVKVGEHVALVGESGAGKSTLLNSLVGLVRPVSGSLCVLGKEVIPENIREIRKRVGWLPQEVQLPYATVLEMLETPYHFKMNKDRKFDRKLYEQALVRMGLPSSIMDKALHKTSGGERQRLLIVSALLQGREILLMDEPTSALDHENRDRFIEYLRELKGTTILAITHDPDFAESMDRKIVMKRLT